MEVSVRGARDYKGLSGGRLKIRMVRLRSYGWAEFESGTKNWVKNIETGVLRKWSELGVPRGNGI